MRSRNARSTRGPITLPDAIELTDRQVDARAVGRRAELRGVVGVVRPAVPLDPTDRDGVLLDQEHEGRLATIDAWLVLRANAGQVLRAVPPAVDVRRRQPALQLGKIIGTQRSEAKLVGHRLMLR
jgi:hypothetical protein